MKNIFLLSVSLFICSQSYSQIIIGAERFDVYIQHLENKKVGFTGNHTSIIDKIHVVDTLLQQGVNVVKLYSPEHGFRGKADAGQHVKDGTDEKTGLPIISLYGNNKKPTNNNLKGVEIMVFDIQDVGARFYTYISTLHYIMEACAENNIPLIVLDRPNPNGSYVDGPVLDTNFRSFIGMHPIPVVHGMTIGEYAKMINGEKWLKNEIECSLIIVPMLNYERSMNYDLPVKPSPNLPNSRSIALYPSLCFFEGTSLSVGRGTNMQFQVIGHPLLKDLGDKNFSFTPEPNEGAQKPLLQGQVCYGFDLRNEDKSIDSIKQLNLNYLISAYKIFPDKSKFFLKNNMFNLLAGNNLLRQQIIEGKTEDEIRETWKDGINSFKAMREKYLIYTE